MLGFFSQNNKWIFILVTMFLNFLGFSIIIPILPFLVQKYVATDQIAFYVGLTLSSYALCQFIAAPALGVISDRVGRKPVLLVSLLGTVIGYLFMSFGASMWMLLLGRVIDGLTGGNISTIFAYTADITPPQERGKHFGMLGAAGGFGFMIGPALGGFLAHYNLVAPLFVAAGIAFLNMVWGYFVLTESLPEEHKIPSIDLSHLNPFTQFSHIFSAPILRQLFIMAFFFFLAMNALYGTASVFLKDVFIWTPTQIGLFLFAVGIIDIITQGFLVRKLIPGWGEAKLAVVGLLVTIVGFLFGIVTAVTSLIILLYASAVLNVGDGFFEPAESALVSIAAGPKMQGKVQGANQGMQSVARIIGPLVAAWLYSYWRGLPYILEAVLVMISLVMLFFLLPAIKKLA